MAEYYVIQFKEEYHNCVYELPTGQRYSTVSSTIAGALNEILNHYGKYGWKLSNFIQYNDPFYLIILEK